MRLPRPALIATATVTAAASLLLTPNGAVADPAPQPPVREGSAPSDLSDRAARTPESTTDRALTAPVTELTGPAGGTRGYPREQVLTPDPENPADKSIKLGLTPYHAIAPKLNALQRLGDRVSVEIAGRSAGGHRLFLVTVTAPESSRQARAQERMRELIENAPAAAAKDPVIKAAYKTPVFFNNNIHGNEWEGTDASLELIEQLATAKDRATTGLLARSRVYFNITANPDGRIAGTRANANGFDMNRDFVTASQPEVRAMRQIAIDKQPAVMVDLHGYVNGTLIEPTTPPHGENYEYDLFLKNTYANALGMEAAVNGLGYTPEKDGVEPAQIPFRDQEEGWDDWPPIFTPQYMPFHGTVAAHTVEFPMRVNNAAYDSLPVAELRRRSAINVGIAGAAMRASLDHTRTHRASLIADQIEVFRRSTTGAAQVPVSPKTVPGVPGIGPEDVYTTEFPRAYVIPAGGKAQRSATAAARLVDHLLANDVQVRRATRDFRLGGKAYAKGSYVVDLHQPKRGMANVLLSDGRDISDKVSTMYDISGWSLGRLWGATVDTVRTARLSVPARTVEEATNVGYVAPRGTLRLRLDDAREIAALNSLLADGVSVRQSPDGSALVPASARTKARALAKRYDVAFDATKTTGGGTPLLPVRVAAAVTPGELFALREMNFDVTPVSTAVLNAGFDWSTADVLFASAGLNHAGLDTAARAALDGFLARGGLVGRGATGAALNAAAGLLAVQPVEGNEDANGVVRVANAPTGVTAGAPDHGFVYAPLWFTDLGPGVRVEQSYATGNPLVSGHWRPLEDGTGGPAQAAGRASVVSGPHAVLFGTEPLFRAHPKGEFAQVARALLTVSRGES